MFSNSGRLFVRNFKNQSDVNRPIIKFYGKEKSKKEEEIVSS